MTTSSSPLPPSELYAVLVIDGDDAYFTDINDGTAGHDRSDQRDIGTRKQAVDFMARWPYGYHLCRVLGDGAFEAALAAAKEEGRREGLALLREKLAAERDDAAIDAKERDGEGSHESGYVTGLTWAIDVLDSATKEKGS